MRKGQLGSVSFFILIFVLMVILLLIVAFAAPVNSLILANLAKGADNILTNTADDINSIQDADVREAVNDALDSAKAAGNDNIQVNTMLYRFGWVFFGVILFVVIYLILFRESNTVSAGRFV